MPPLGFVTTLPAPPFSALICPLPKHVEGPTKHQLWQWAKAKQAFLQRPKNAVFWSSMEFLDDLSRDAAPLVSRSEKRT